MCGCNLGVTGTEVAAMTIHALLDLNPDMESKLDFTKGNPKTAVLMSLDVLFIDEVGTYCRYPCRFAVVVRQTQLSRCP